MVPAFVRRSEPRLDGVLTGNSPYPTTLLRTSVKLAKQPSRNHKAPSKYGFEDNEAQRFCINKGADRVPSTKCKVEGNDLLRYFWKSAVEYWGKSRTRSSWLLSGIIFLILLVNLAATYGINAWTRAIFDALQNRDSA